MIAGLEAAPTGYDFPLMFHRVHQYFEARPLSRGDKWMLSFSAVILGAGALYLLFLLCWFLLILYLANSGVRIDL